MNDRIISFWQSVHNLPVIKIIYYSETSCSKTIMADVNRETHTIERLISAEVFNQWNEIEPFVCYIFTGVDRPEGFRRLNYFGNDLTFIREAFEVIDYQYRHSERGGDDYWNLYYLYLHVNSFLHCHYHYFDASNLRANAIKDMLDDYYLNHFSEYGNKKSCYCGITNDVDIRMAKHIDNHDFIIRNNIVVAYLCRSREIAEQVEELMGNEYDIGERNIAGNGAEDDTRYVYLLSKA